MGMTSASVGCHSQVAQMVKPWEQLRLWLLTGL